MSLIETLRLAFESLFANKVRATLTMLGMIIGVGAVVLLVSIGNGAKNYITGEFEGLGTNLIIIQPGKTDAKNGMAPPVGGAKKNLYLADVAAIEHESIHVESITGVMWGAGTAKTVDGSVNTNILGSSDQFVRIFNVRMGQGQFISKEEDEAGRRVAVLGHNVAKNLFPEKFAVGQSIKVNESEHRVIGVLAPVGNKLGFNMDDIVFLPTRTAMRLFNEDKLFGMRGKAKNKLSMNDAVEEIKDILRKRQNGEENFTIVTQGSMLETMNTILSMLTVALGGIAAISMLVGGIGIMNIMLVSVMERTREIGIRRAVGARRTDILRQFLVEALVLSFTGGLVGLVGAVAITYLVYLFVPTFDMRAPAWVLAPAFGLSLFTGVVFGVWPAKKASMLETIEALRYE